MTAVHNRRWLIADRPLGRALVASDFRSDEVPLAAPAEGEATVRTLYLGFDPAQKGFMENVATYADATSVGAVMTGTGVGQVIESRAPALLVGSLVCGPLGWQEYANVPAAQLEPVRRDIPLTAALGTVGMTGRTAYFGLLHVGKPRAGDTLVISGAAGAVGSIVGQIGRIAGCRVIGIAGGAAKCESLVRDLGFDAAIDYKSEKLRARLRELCPRGIDVFFDNVGGSILNDALGRLAPHARVVICGGITRYNADPRSPEQLPPGPQNYFNVVFTQATIQGFLVHHYAEHYATATQRLADWTVAGRIRQLEDVLEGFDNAPRALMRLFEGANSGKQLLRVAEPDLAAIPPPATRSSRS
jgi:NADPH-dependent curcumin reductase CurA